MFYRIKQYINKLLSESFEGWTEEEIKGYKTAMISVLEFLKKEEKQEYLLCSAIKRVEPVNCIRVYHEPYHDIYKYELGWRHPDIIHKFGSKVSKSPNDQGFLTSKCRFVTREEGEIIARKAGQIDKIIGGHLTSEDLY